MTIKDLKSIIKDLNDDVVIYLGNNDKYTDEFEIVKYGKLGRNSSNEMCESISFNGVDFRLPIGVEKNLRIKPYRLKHTPTRLYYQPISGKDSHFSKKGKIYQTKNNLLTLGYYSDGSPRKEIRIEAHKDALIYKEYKDILVWEEPNSWNGRCSTITFSEDWIVEEM